MEKIVKWEEYKTSIDSNQDNNESDSIGMVSMLGAIYLKKSVSLEKTFNFEVMHTNFPITELIHNRIDNIRGVETLDILTKYRARIGFASLFDKDLVKSIIERQIKGYPLEIEYIAITLDDKSNHWAIVIDDNHKNHIYLGEEIEEVKNKINEENIKEKRSYKSWIM